QVLPGERRVRGPGGRGRRRRLRPGPDRQAGRGRQRPEHAGDGRHRPDEGPARRPRDARDGHHHPDLRDERRVRIEGPRDRRRRLPGQAGRAKTPRGPHQGPDRPRPRAQDRERVMASGAPDILLDGPAVDRAEVHFREHHDRILRGTDRLFARLLAAEWLVGIAVAVVISPLAWAGIPGAAPSHLWTAVLLGGGIVALPIALALTRPGEPVTRHGVAVGQMLFAGLLVHLTGGRTETHFFVFGSLAVLAFYRDWRVL